MLELQDFSKLDINYERAGMYGGNSGNKEAVYWKDNTWIIKYPKSTRSMDVQNVSYTTSPLSEFIGSHIYNILGIDVHDTVLGYRNGKIVVGCRDFCEDGEILKEFRTIKNYANISLTEEIEEKTSSSSDINKVDLEELLIHLQKNDLLLSVYGAEERFWEMVVVDILINNNDRNNGNWGLIYGNGTHRLAPVFDNGASFSNKISEEKIKEILSDRNKLESSAVNGRTAFFVNDKLLTASKMIRFDNPGLHDAILRLTPLIESKMEDIEKFIYEVPTYYNSELVCSLNRKELYTEGIDIRFKKLIEPQYRAIKEDRNIVDTTRDEVLS